MARTHGSNRLRALCAGRGHAAARMLAVRASSSPFPAFHRGANPPLSHTKGCGSQDRYRPWHSLARCQNARTDLRNIVGSITSIHEIPCGTMLGAYDSLIVPAAWSCLRSWHRESACGSNNQNHSSNWAGTMAIKPAHHPLNSIFELEHFELFWDPEINDE
jgi:hypothetical protein